MKIFPKKILAFFAVLALLIVFAEPEFPKKIFRFTKSLIKENIPTYSERSFLEAIKDSSQKIKKESLLAFLPHMNINSLDLTLSKLPKRELMKIGAQDFQVIEYRANFLTLEKRKPEIGPAYIDFIEEGKLMIAQENGLFFSLLLDRVFAEEKSIKVESYESNITDFVNYFDFYFAGQFGIKDILVADKVIYVSYIREFQNDCFNVSILKAEIKKYLEFSILFSPQECIDRDITDFNAHQTGGRLSKYQKNKILLSTGSFRSRIKAQDVHSTFGKILSIDLDSGISELISMGHRNPQGLTYSPKYNDVFSTEHGPNGGDEVNYNATPGKLEIANFGWPISSYGGHYGASSYDLVNSKLQLTEFRSRPVYELAPLFKSHADYNFLEPFINFSPSVGISQIIEVQHDYTQTGAARTFIFGTMGSEKSELIPMLSMFFISTDKENNLILKEQLLLKERMRDLVFDKKNNSVIFSGDLNGVIGVMRPVN